MTTVHPGAGQRTRTSSRIGILWIGPLEAELAGVLREAVSVDLTTAASGTEALDILTVARFDLVVASFPIPEWSPAELVEEIHRVDDLLRVIVLDPGGAIADAVRTIKLGAYEYLGSNFQANALVHVVQAAVEDQRARQLLQLSQCVEDGWKRFLVGESRALQDVERIIRLVAARRCTVLITGETGTGKEMVARAVHLASNRSHRPMVAVNCSAIPDNLLEAELFGHTKGAFTGAVAQRIGRFEQAHGSTLFLDEIGDMPFDLQAKLLRVLQEREIQRLGGSESIKVDVRVVAASNVNLAERVKAGRFREDLYYRLNVVPVKLPPLRERLTDIPLLVHHFIEKVCRAEDIPPKRIAREAIERLLGYSWPGNIRELENAVEMAAVLSGERRDLYPADFPLPSNPNRDRRCVPQPGALVLDGAGLDFERAVSSFERSIIEQALAKANGNKSVAADMLHLPRTTLISKLRALAAQEA